MNKSTLTKCITIGTSLMIGLTAHSQKGLPPEEKTTVTRTTNFPQVAEFTPERLKMLKVPNGWEVSVAASGLGKPRMLYVGNKGELYVTRRDGGDILLMTDKDNDQKFEDVKVVVSDFKGVHGITIKDGWLYGCNNSQLQRFRLNADGTVNVESKELLIKDMLSGGQHPNRTMDFGPDGMLYISIGSTCNDCKEGDKEAATLVQVNPKTWKRTIYASGLRNMIGFDWHPQTKELWGFDNGGDYKGDEWPPEELNQIKIGGNYGFPFVYAKQEVDKSREHPGDTPEEFAKTTEPSIMEFPAHAAPIAYRFFKSEANSGDGLICWHGSWNRDKPTGYKVERIKFSDGKPVGSEDFLSGFLINGGTERFGRPAGVAITNEGIVYISDDAGGIIYCIKPKK